MDSRPGKSEPMSTERQKPPAKSRALAFGVRQKP